MNEKDIPRVEDDRKSPKCLSLTHSSRMNVLTVLISLKVSFISVIYNKTGDKTLKLKLCNYHKERFEASQHTHFTQLSY